MVHDLASHQFLYKIIKSLFFDPIIRQEDQRKRESERSECQIRL